MRDDSSEAGRRILREVGRFAVFRRGDRLIVAGAVSDEVLLVEAGVVKAVLLDRDGTEKVVGLFGHGDLLGELGVTGHRPRSAHVVALSTGRAMRVPGDVFLRLQAKNRDVRELLDETWRKRQQHADDRQLAQNRDVTTRVAESLLRWAQAFGHATDQGLLMRGLSQRDIANAVSASEKSVEAALSELRAARLLRTGRLWYSLASPHALEKLIDDPESGPGR